MDFDLRGLSTIRILPHADSFFSFSATQRNGKQIRCDLTSSKPRSRMLTNALSITARVHKKRKHQTDAYHKRIQKKWSKRVATEGSGCKLAAFSPTVLSISTRALYDLTR